MLRWLLPSNRRAALRRELRDQVVNSYWVEVGLRAGLRDASDRADRAEALAADLRRREAARAEALTIVLEAKGRLSPLQIQGLLADPPAMEDGRLDGLAFAAAVLGATVQLAREIEVMQGGYR